MTLALNNAVLSQVINVSNTAIGDTILIPSGNIVNLSGILTATSGNFTSLRVNNIEVGVGISQEDSVINALIFG